MSGTFLSRLVRPITDQHRTDHLHKSKQLFIYPGKGLRCYHLTRLVLSCARACASVQVLIK